MNHLTKNKERTQNNNKKNKQKIQDIVIKIKLNKAYFQHDIVLREFKNLRRRTCDNILHNKAFNIAKYPDFDESQRRLLQWFKTSLLLYLQINLIVKGTRKEF